VTSAQAKEIMRRLKQAREAIADAERSLNSQPWAKWTTQDTDDTGEDIRSASARLEQAIEVLEEVDAIQVVTVTDRMNALPMLLCRKVATGELTIEQAESKWAETGWVVVENHPDAGRKYGVVHYASGHLIAAYDTRADAERMRASMEAKS